MVIQHQSQNDILPNEEISIKGEFWTALHYACHFNQPDILKYFLGVLYKHYGIGKYEDLMTINTKDGWNPLMISCIYNKPDTLKVLLEAGGIDLQQKDKNGRTGEDLAKFYGAIDSFETIFEWRKKNLGDKVPVNEPFL